MQKANIKLIKVFTILLFCQTLILGVHASTLIEPYLGYTAISKIKYSLNISVDSEGEESDEEFAEWSYKTFIMGVRTGMTINQVKLGLDFSRSSFDVSGGSDQAPINLNGSYTGTFIGIFAGYKFPYNIQAHYTYFLSSRFTSTATDTQGDSLRGDGFAFSVGYALYEWFAPRLEYRRHKMEKYVEDGSGNETITANRYTTTEWLLLLSFPLDL